MPYTNISALPEAPIRGDVPATFATKANAFVAALPTFRTEVNAAGSYFDGQVGAAATSASNAAASAVAADASEANCVLLEASVVGTANFKGLWADLVGALNKPASVAHENQVWLLLNNLANVAASEPGVTGDWQVAVAPPTSVNLDITANSNGITAGNVVELVSTGGQNVQNIYHCEAPTISTLLNTDGTNNATEIVLGSFGNGRAMLIQSDSGYKAKILSISGSAAPVLESSSASNAFYGKKSIAILDTNHAAIASLDANGLYIWLATDNGTTNAATISAANTNTAANSNITPATCALTSSNWFVAYADTNSDCQILTAVSNGTNAPTLGTALNVNGTNNANYLSLARTTDTTAILVFQNASDSNARIAHITGGTTNAPTTSALAYLDGTNNCNYITQSPIDSNHTLCAYNNATTGNGCLAVIQANGTNAPTVISRATFDTDIGATKSYTGLTAHTSNTHSLIYRSTGADGFNVVVNIDSSYNITTSSILNFYGTNDVTYNAIAALTPTTAIAAFQGTGSDGFAGTLTLTPTPVLQGQPIGIAQTSATNGASATVAVGPVVAGTFTAGLDYYVSGSGGISTNATPVHVLKAKSTTEGVLDLRGAPEAGKQQVWEITTPGAFTWTAPEDGEYTIVGCGGGGSGGYAWSSWTYSVGGNGGNTATKTLMIRSSQSITGTVGSGGAAQTTNGSSGNNGANTTFTVDGITTTIIGGMGGLASTNADVKMGRRNLVAALNIEGTIGIKAGDIDCGGCSPILTITAAVKTSTGAGVAGTRGGGGTGGSSTSSGAGGDGVVRIEHIWGDR